MAIAKVGSTGKSAGAIAYVLSENKEATKQPEILAGSFGTQAEIKQEFEAYNKLNTRVKNQATHISISFALGERVKTEKKIEFAEKLLEKLDFKNVPYLVVEHYDKEYEHFHIIAGRIRDDGTTVKEWKIAERAIDATKELEKSLGLQQTEYTKSNDRRIKSNEYKQMERTNELSVMAEAKLTIDEILRDEPTTKDFVENLQNSGFEVRPNISEKTGRMNGFSFKKGEITFKSSAIAKNYSWQNLQKNGLNYDQKRDTEFLIGVKNEFTKELNLESGRDRGNKTPKSLITGTEPAIDGKKSITGRSESFTDRRTENEFNESANRIAGFENQNSKVKSIETDNLLFVGSAAKQSDETEISDGAIHGLGTARKSSSTKTNAQNNSRIGGSADGFIEIDLKIQSPKLKPAPKHEMERKETHVKEKEHSWGKGR